MKQPIVQLLLFLSVISLLPTLLFVQKGNPWNTIQFGYYSLYFMALFAGYVLSVFMQKFATPVRFALCAFILPVSALSSFTTFTFGLYKKPPAMLTQKEHEALQFLRHQPEGVVLIYPYREDLKGEIPTNPYPLSVYTYTDYVSAFSGKVVYLGDVEQQKILQTDYVNRTGFLIDQRKVSYIYLPKIYGVSFGKESGLTIIFDNSEVLIYSKEQ